MLQHAFWGGLVGLSVLASSLPADSPMVPAALSSPRTIAQGNVSPADLQKFANAIGRFQAIDAETQNKLASVVEKHGLSEERFMQIAESQRDSSAPPPASPSAPPSASPSAPSSTPVTDADREKFNRALEEMKPILEADRDRKESALTASGLTIEQFQSIGDRVQKDPNLQEQVRQLLKK